MLDDSVGFPLIVIGFPMFLLYIATIYRFLQKRIETTRHVDANKVTIVQALSLEDAAFISLVIDFTVLFQKLIADYHFNKYFVIETNFGLSSTFFLIITIFLILLHFSVLLITAYFSYSSKFNGSEKTMFTVLVHFYLILGILFTNAFTVINLLGMMVN